MKDDPQSDPSNPTRRAFLQTTAGTAAAVVIGATVPAHANSTSAESASPVEIADGAEHRGRGTDHAAHQRQGPPTSRRPSYDAPRLHP